MNQNQENHHHHHHHRQEEEQQGQQRESKGRGAEAEVCMVENRDAEANSKIDRSVVADHVWETCRPGSRFMMKSPTVSVRRIQLMRAQLQFNPREWESEAAAEEAPRPNCPKPAKPKAGCRCGLRYEGMGRSTSYSTTTSSVSDVIHACPDECHDAEATTEREEEENDLFNY